MQSDLKCAWKVRQGVRGSTLERGPPTRSSGGRDHLHPNQNGGRVPSPHTRTVSNHRSTLRAAELLCICALLRPSPPTNQGEQLTCFYIHVQLCTDPRWRVLNRCSVDSTQRRPRRHNQAESDADRVKARPTRGTALTACRVQYSGDAGQI